MVELRACLTELGLTNIKTYVQTGNVLFESDKPRGDLKPLIEKALGQRFNYEAFVLLYPADTLRGIVEHFPFTVDDTTHRYVIFCGDQATIDDLTSHQAELDPQLEAVAAGDTVVYWRVPVGSTLGTPFAKIMAKPKYKAVTTNRNINTLQKMVADL